MRAAWCIIALVVLTSAKPSKKLNNRNRRDVDHGESDVPSSRSGSFDPSQLDSLTSTFQDIFTSASNMSDLMNGFLQFTDQLEGMGSFGDVGELDDEEFESFMGSSFGNMVSQFSENMPDPMSDPEAFASFAASIEEHLAKLGDFGNSLVNSFFDQKLAEEMAKLGITSFEDGHIEASDFFSQMDTDSWKVMEDLMSHTDVFEFEGVSNDDFFGVIEMAGDLGEQFETFVHAVNDSSRLTPDLLIQLPPELFSILKPHMLQKIAGNLSVEQTQALCMNLMYTDPETAQGIFENVDCITALANMDDFEPDPEYEEAMMESMRSSKPLGQWTDEDWDKMARFPRGFDPEDFDSMPDDVLLRNLDKFSMHTEDMEEDDFYAIFDGMESAFGDFSQMNSTMFSMMGPMLQFMPLEHLEMIPPDQKYAALDAFAGIELDDDMAAEFAEDILGVMPSFDSWTPLEFGRAMDFIKYDEDAMDMIPINTIIGSLDKMGKYDFDEHEAATITDRIMEDALWGNAQNWNSTMIMNAGSLLSGFDPAFIDDLPPEALFDAMSSNISKFDTIDFPRSSARGMLEKVITKVGGIENVNLAMLGQLAKAFTSSEMAQFSADMIADGIDQLVAAYDDMDQSTRRTIYDKLKTDPAAVRRAFRKLGPFFAEITLDEVDALPYDIIDPKMAKSLKLTIKPTEAQARRIWSNVVRRLGPPDRAAANWTINVYKAIDRAICGAPCADLKKMPLGKKFASLIERYASLQSNGECLSDAQMRCFATRIKSFIFKANSTTPNFKYLTKANVKKIAQFLPFFTLAELNAFNTTLCGTVIGAIGKYKLPNLGRPDLIKLKNYALTCSGKKDNVQEKITVNELRAAGDIACGIEVADVGRLDTKIFTNRFKKISERCQFPLAVEDALFDRALKIFNINSSAANITEKELLILGPAVRNLNNSMLAKVPPAIMVKAVGRIKNAMDKFDKKMESIAKSGMDTDINESDRATLNNRKRRFYEKVAAAIVTKRTQDAAKRNGNNRRKRATTYSSLTCSDLKKMGSGVSSLSTSQLDLSNTEFNSCYEFLGQQKAWSDAQKTTLVTVTKRAWGATSTWTVSKTTQLGTIAQGMTTTELQSFTYTTDIISAWGAYTDWTSAQLSAVFDRWLVNTQSGSASKVDSTELQSIGVFACGASTTQIASSFTTAYKNAALKIGTLTVCDEPRLQAYTSQAKANTGFGAVSTWDASTIATVGTVIGGLSAAEIASLSSTQLEAVSTTTITSMPTTAFAGFTSSQLSSMSSSQVRSISTTQAAALSPSAMGTLTSSSNYIGNTAGGSNISGNSGSANISVNLVLQSLVFLFVAIRNL